jgi:N-dimethylarginine dimethylaminohydrolase
MINKHILMSGPELFATSAEINPFMDGTDTVNGERALEEHNEVRLAFEEAGIHVTKVEPPKDCQDGVYTANWALVRGEKAVLASLPNARKAEEEYAEKILQSLGKMVVRVPDGLHFSGQGDALPCGNLLFAGSGYRSDPEAQQFVANHLGYNLIQLQTVPLLDTDGREKINEYSGWPDSYFYDIDLALSVLREPRNGQKGIIAWCPDAFTSQSQEVLRNLDDVEKIEVSLEEAEEGFACNLVSTGSVVIMSSHAPEFEGKLRERGFGVITPVADELSKGGGFIRCVGLTLD